MSFTVTFVLGVVGSSLVDICLTHAGLPRSLSGPIGPERPEEGFLLLFLALLGIEPRDFHILGKLYMVIEHSQTRDPPEKG